MIKSFSWVIEGQYAMKRLDKSAIFNNESGIPKEIAHFFDLAESPNRMHRQITLIYQGIDYSARLRNDIKGRFKISWEQTFALKLRYKLAKYTALLEKEGQLDDRTAPLMRFKLVATDTYEVDLFNFEEKHEQEILSEGGQLQYLLTRYERSSVVREHALAIHGYNCKACNFNFEETYGELGSNFIEIHHVNPLSHIKSTHEVNPATDLVPLCANCHRMVHRDWMHVIPVEELREIIRRD